LLYFDKAIEFCSLFFLLNGSHQGFEGLSDNEKILLKNLCRSAMKVKQIGLGGEKSLKELVEIETKDSNEQVFLSVLLFMHCPDSFYISDLFDERTIETLRVDKTSCAIAAFVDEGYNFSEAKKKLKLNNDPETSTLLPAVMDKRYGEMEEMRTELSIREFFAKYPYAAVIEAAKTLKISNKDVRRVINKIESTGEKIKYSNTLRTLDFESLKARILEIKKANPSIADRDLSYELEAPLTDIRRAIQEVARVWQLENSESYGFQTMKSIDSFELIKKLALERFNASPSSSSRWLEVAGAMEKEIVEILGIKAPARVDIRQTMEHSSKEQRDAAIDAYIATEVLDADFTQIKLTGEKTDDV
jgi:hypothetical protein